MTRSSVITKSLPLALIAFVILALGGMPTLAAADPTVNLHAESTMIPAWVAGSMILGACTMVAALVWFLAQLTGGVNVRLASIESEIRHLRHDLDSVSKKKANTEA
jgi:hypothetical protein